MRIAVCVKPVGGELSAFDASALEQALRLDPAEICVVSMCPPSAEGVLRSLTRLGASRVILISDPLFAGSDTLATAYILSRQLQKLAPDLILCGRQSVDGDTAQVGPALSAMLGYGLLTHVLELQLTENTLRCTTRLGLEEISLPAVITMERSLSLRFPSIRSKAKDIERVDNRLLGADPARCGLNGSPTRVLSSQENTAGQRQCRMIRPEELEGILHAAMHKPRQALEIPDSPVKLPHVWAVGPEVEAAAKRIGQDITVIAELDPRKIAERAASEQPEAILWNADVLGRRNAPIAAALLKTGLCADCTGLDTDGAQLFMTRPARGGSILARIVCRTKPQMATVRTVVESGQMIVAAGSGVAGQIDSVRAFAGAHGAEFGASRALVDAGLAAYPLQVGLTGRMVSPAVYLAVGISGAVQHTCAIESAGTVIAINPDPRAPIFSCADYGIVCSWEEFLKSC